jgi:hypothetical protein
MSGLIGAFDLGAIGKFWFAESSFDLLGFFQKSPSENDIVEMKTLPIERDSSFVGAQFSELFSPVLVGTSEHPLPGVYIDSTLVRGNRVSVATLDPARKQLEKSLRYSLQLPPNCVQMDPVHLDARIESFALPLFCQTLPPSSGGQPGVVGDLQFRLVLPNGVAPVK